MYFDRQAERLEVEKKSNLANKTEVPVRQVLMEGAGWPCLPNMENGVGICQLFKIQSEGENRVYTLKYKM